jgi:hypothetical protein
MKGEQTMPIAPTLVSIPVGAARPIARPPVDELIGTLAGFSRLMGGWDGYGAHPIDPRIIESVSAFAARLPEPLLNGVAAVPTSRGGVQLEWNRGRRGLELEFETPDTIHYLKCDPSEGIEEEYLFPAADTGRAIGLLKWFHEGGDGGERY